MEKGRLRLNLDFLCLELEIEYFTELTKIKIVRTGTTIKLEYMRPLIFFNNKKYIERLEYSSEKSFENRIKQTSRQIFGEKIIFLDFTNLVSTRSLEGAIHDGVLFDFGDEENPEFYIVEVELEKHDFYGHIFPQQTKFSAFIRNQNQRALPDNYLPRSGGCYGRGHPALY